jgi:hypothetical protein
VNNWGILELASSLPALPSGYAWELMTVPMEPAEVSYPFRVPSLVGGSAGYASVFGLIFLRERLLYFDFCCQRMGKSAV